MGQRSKHHGDTFEPLPTCGTKYPKSMAKNINILFARCGRDRGHRGDHECFGTYKEDPHANKMGKISWPRTRAQTYVR